jgi:hypothetical protein
MTTDNVIQFKPRQTKIEEGQASDCLAAQLLGLAKLVPPEWHDICDEAARKIVLLGCLRELIGNDAA